MSLDYVYTPSRDVAADARYLTDVLGGTLVFAIDAMGARVACVELTVGPPAIVLNDHVEGDRPILVYRVADLRAASGVLSERGWQAEHTLEIPQGPVTTFSSPGGQRLAIYELARPGVIETFAGRQEF
ncbi:MAG TPA: hypothetical protein VFV72_11445 [Candidatus Limnocylindrales bacterium]|nr:hypothetical protein [Candidatus Limnocylindrales bacterium]